MFSMFHVGCEVLVSVYLAARCFLGFCGESVMNFIMAFLPYMEVVVVWLTLLLCVVVICVDKLAVAVVSLMVFLCSEEASPVRSCTFLSVSK